MPKNSGITLQVDTSLEGEAWQLAQFQCVAEAGKRSRDAQLSARLTALLVGLNYFYIEAHILQQAVDIQLLAIDEYSGAGFAARVSCSIAYALGQGQLDRRPQTRKAAAAQNVGRSVAPACTHNEAGVNCSATAAQRSGDQRRRLVLTFVGAL